MTQIEQVKASINGLSISDQTDVLLHILRLKYRATVQEIQKLTSSTSNNTSDESIEYLSYDELLERLHLLENIREGLLSSVQEPLVHHDEIKKRFDSWRKK